MNKKIIITIAVYTLFINDILSQSNCKKEDWLQKNLEVISDSPFNQKLLSDYQVLDFSQIMLSNPDTYIGLIGKNKKRLYVKFNSLTKSLHNTSIYFVIGQTVVGINKRNFYGSLEIKRILSLEEYNFGIDDWMKGKIIDQGVAIGEYKFFENPKLSATGEFCGTFICRWYIDNNGILRYDNIDNDSDSYCNNQFMGTWTSYKTKKTIQCCWGQYRIPGSGDLDIGAAEFSPNPSYYRYGWDNYIP
ncbi:hypothetical protein DMA11_01835 [Marinilabiliaceae bacterium JC017]|nr:hypothetical protein DMA11_01835 [Marinilabiliaceae bacterium JC017]